MKTTRAFTLIELLIASLIFVLVMSAAYSAFHAGIFGSRSIENNIAVYQSARKILERLDRDLRNSFCYAENESKFTGTSSKLGFLTSVDSYRKNNITQDYAFVSYELDGDKLMRLCRKNQDSLNDKSEARPQEMASGVEVSFEYAHIGSDGVLKWLNEWNNGDDPEGVQKKLPAAVRIKLIFKDKIKKEFERTVFLPLAE